jgi:hypothetical protein
MKNTNNSYEIPIKLPFILIDRAGGLPYAYGRLRQREGYAYGTLMLTPMFV